MTGEIGEGCQRDKETDSGYFLFLLSVGVGEEIGMIIMKIDRSLAGWTAGCLAGGWLAW